MDTNTPATQDAIQGRRRLALALMQQGTDASPVQHWTQAAARAAQALVGGYYGGEANRASQQREAYDTAEAQKRQGESRAYAEGATQRGVQQKMLLAEQAGLKPGSPEFQQYVYGIKPPDPNADLDRRYKEAQIQALQQRSGQENTRLQQLEKLGLDPNSAEGMAFLANGKLPQAVIEQRLQQERRAATAPKIAAGLNNLGKMADTYNDPAFENAAGPIQGATPDGLMSSIPINTARLVGEVGNWWQGGNANPSEVRNNISGSTEALAAAIKPLIRAPGEGVWTDQDQARLVAIVGDLAQSRDKAEFKRRLNAVRDRIESNFDLDIPFEAFGLDGSALQGRGSKPMISDGRFKVEFE